MSYSMDDIAIPDRSPDSLYKRKMDMDLWHESNQSPSRSIPAISAKQGMPKVRQLRDVPLAPEVEQWLEQQQFLWRHNRLSAGQVCHSR